MASSEIVPEDLNLKFRSKFNPGFTNHGCLHCAILKALYSFNEKRDQKLRDIKFLLQNVQNKIFEILKVFKSNMKFTRAACWINSKINSGLQHHTHSMLRLYLLIIMLLLLTMLNPVKLHFLKSLKLNSSNTTCSSSMWLIFNK